MVNCLNSFSVISVVVHNENMWFGAQNTCIGIHYTIYGPEKRSQGDFVEKKKLCMSPKKEFSMLFAWKKKCDR